ncbi:fasciclin domain-containing protein [Mucilaginibacter sp. HMF5004]|uniref:fasciclin domain-containing protein n=1 Tax=Mucilaginibacter rivuli TaxID=2857527 RepID=UPI001C5EB2EF|nr:fasciclin domain-containing protein [Mucilaginibacter rivuli]MBW4888508.1 fasciclin domain-containing protein [Mucilaginibacter rivuli]
MMAAGCLLISSCKSSFDDYYSNNSNTKGGYLYSKLQGNPKFSIFTAGLKRASIDPFISSGGLYTVFAPTDSAFNVYLKAKNYSTINDVPIDTLFSVLSYHIVNNMWYYYDFKVRFQGFQQSLFLTRSKKFVNVSVAALDTLSVNGVPVIKSLRDIGADNGVIHGIGQVLIPNANLEQKLLTDPQLNTSTFYRLMKVCSARTYDRFNSYDKNHDGLLDSVFYTAYPYLSTVYTAIEYQTNTLASDQGGDPVFTTILMPTNAVLDPIIAPTLAKIGSTVTDKIAALSPIYAKAVLESYFIGLQSVSSNTLIKRPTVLSTVNGATIPALTAGAFVRPDIIASNGVIHIINTTFPTSDLLKSGIGQALSDPELSTFWLAVQKAGLLSTYGVSSRAGTLFAPTNAALASAGLDLTAMTLNGAPLTTATLTNLIKVHMINSNLASTALPNAVLGTDLSSTEQLTFDSTGKKVTSPTGNVANITLPAVGIGPSNIGYVYKIDQLLIPQ